MVGLEKESRMPKCPNCNDCDRVWWSENKDYHLIFCEKCGGKYTIPKHPNQIEIPR